jgi:hypothetical protein
MPQPAVVRSACTRRLYKTRVVQCGSRRVAQTANPPPSAPRLNRRPPKT